jgi:flavin reductase (DIM6/NTAB) family NADH-FMN oxidoreductase RutF
METREFRTLMGRFATGVTVVTTLDATDHPAGLTANSLASVSLDPILVSVAVDHRSESLAPILSRGSFVVNVLTHDHTDLAARFASPLPRSQRWSGVDWSPGPEGGPVLAGALAWLECSVWKSLDAGDHCLIIGEVLHGSGTPGDPLLYFEGAYRRIASP